MILKGNKEGWINLKLGHLGPELANQLPLIVIEMKEKSGTGERGGKEENGPHGKKGGGA